MRNAAVRAAGPVVEKFASTSGRWLGWVGIVLGLVAVGGAVVGENSNSLDTVAIGLSVSVASWVVLVRPRVSLHEGGVLLRNMVRDTFVPFGVIEHTHAAQTLQVRTADKTYHGIGVSRSARTVLREAGHRGILSGGGLMPSFGGPKASPEPTRTFANQEQTAGPYASYVEQRVLNEADGSADDGSTVVGAFDLFACVAVAVAAAVALAAILA